MKVLVLTDNKFLLKNFLRIIESKKLNLKSKFFFAYSYNNPAPSNLVACYRDIFKINVKSELKIMLKNYDLIFSLHCKQIFPKELVVNKTCINVHPGFNPYNRGWFPQIFSIINKNPIGATIHIMDENIDHGPIIAQKEIIIESFDTSKTIYDKILNLEIELITNNIESLLTKKYKAMPPSFEGNYNSRKDFLELCRIKLEEKVTFEQAIDKFRALTHENFKNAFFVDNKGNKVFVRIILERSSAD